MMAAVVMQFVAGLNVSAADTNNPAEIRTRLVQVRAGIIAENTIPEVGSEVVYSFFPDVAYTAIVSRVEQVAAGTVSIQSDAKDDRNITCLSVVSSKGMRLTVRDYDRRRLYQCVSLSEGGWEFREYDLSKELPRTPSPPLIPPMKTEQETEVAIPFDLTRSGNFAIAAATPVYLDVMVVFDTTAQTWAANNGGIAAFAADAIARMNVAMQTTGIDCTFRLAATVNKSYTYAGSGLSTPLIAITDNTGVFSNIETLRTTYGADLVALMVDTGSAYGNTGVGWQMPMSSGYARYAYTTCSIRAVNQGHTHTHEIGHNLGCDHAVNQASSPGPGLFSYSSGYYFTANRNGYHTIMAYNADGYGSYYDDCDYFSTPLKTYGTSGVAVGNSSTADNARTIRETMAVVSAYRTSVIETSPSAPMNVSATDGSSTANVAVTWAASSGATSYSVWRGTSSSSSSAASLSSSVSTTSYTDTSATPGVVYYYWVRASNTSGTSGFSSSNTGYRKLSPPASVSATDGTLTTGVNVTWNSVSGASYYRVYRATSSGGTKTSLGGWQTALSYLDTAVVAGTTYYYFIQAAVNISGTRPSAYSAYATGKKPLLANDAFGSAIAVSGNSGSTSGSTEGATMQAGEPEHHGEATAVNSVWWMWTAPSAGQATFDTIGSSFDTVLAIYTGTAVNSLTAVGSNDDAVGLASRIAINTTAGTVYRIAVAGYGGEYGTVVLNWSFVSATQPTIKDAGITTISGTMYFQVSFKARSGKTYSVQRTDSLTGPSWSTVSTVSVTSDGIKTVSIAIPSNKTLGYFRVKTTE